jgi:hypothetical protein
MHYLVGKICKLIASVALADRRGLGLGSLAKSADASAIILEHFGFQPEIKMHPPSK